MIITTESIVLISRKFGDTSKILTVLTRDHGKLSLLAKGAVSPKSKFGSSLETLSRNRITFYKKSGRDLQTLTNSEINVPMNRIYESPEHILVGMLIAESLNGSLEEYHPHESLYDYFSMILDLLNSKVNNPMNLFTASQAYLASELGFGLELSPYNQVNSRVNERNVFFSLSDGNIFDKSAFNNNLFRFDVEVYEVLYNICSHNPVEICSIDVDKRIQNQINSFFMRYFGFHLERKVTYRTLELMKD